MHQDLKHLDGFEISFHEKSKRIINIKIEDQVIERLIFPFKKFDITALEYKPFTRFTIAKSLDDITSNELSKYLNSILTRHCRSSGKNSIVFRTLFKLIYTDLFGFF